VEHIIQDGGTPGIEEFARGLVDGLGLTIQPSEGEELLRASKPGYTLILHSSPDAGMYDAINRGIARITCEVWAWLNCDEQYLPGTLHYVAEWFGNHPGHDVLCGDALLTDDQGRALSYRRIVAPWWHHTRLVHLASLSCASFYRRSVVEKGGVFDISWRSIGDAEWMARLIKSGVRISACHRLLSSFAFTGQNTSESPLASQEGRRWRSQSDAPSPMLGMPVIWIHRFRKWLAGSYARRNVTYSLHVKGGGERVTGSATGVGWGWPGGEGDGEKPPVDFGATVSVLGTDLLITSYKDLAGRLLKALKGRPLAVDFANTHVITMRRHEIEFASLASSMDLTVPDGMPLVWAMNARGAALRDRVYGPTFTRKFLEQCPSGLSHYLVGGSEECGQRFRERMLALNPSLHFVGGYHGRCSLEGVLEDDAAVLAEIQEKKPDFIWVGLGTPKQYGWIHHLKPRIDHGVVLAVGFAFDVNAGMKPDAPAWMQARGLTWLYRMASEPQRLVSRYLKWNTLFLCYSAWDRFCSDGETVRKWGRKFKSCKLVLRHYGLKVIDLFSSDILDCMTGEKLGRGLVIGWGQSPLVLGHPGLPPLIPKFLPQRRLTYWKQRVGFTTHPAPDYRRLESLPPAVGNQAAPRVMNLVLTHEGGEVVTRLREWWCRVCPEEDFWIVFGGSREAYDRIDYVRKVFISDPGLRKEDNQRGKQSYAGIFKEMLPVVEQERPDYLYLCEYDQLPLVDDLNVRQVQAVRREGADVMGHWLHRVDGTGHYHTLYHEADPRFFPFWEAVSKREDPKVILSMFGSGSFWSREAFEAVARQTQGIECYLEIYLPTLAHHLGFRVRKWKEEDHLISNLPSPMLTLDEAKKKGCWTVHPVKRL
jgi:N-acetylglucosaminyldiphosphoundecaprenol N-acetyl-beta-D-mannosaminyltransferase